MCCLFWIYFYCRGIELVQSTGLARFIGRNVAGFFFFCNINVNIHYKSRCFIVYFVEPKSDLRKSCVFDSISFVNIVLCAFRFDCNDCILHQRFADYFFSLFYIWNFQLGCHHVLILFRMRFCWFGMAAIRIFFLIYCISICGFYLCYALFVVFNSFVITVLRVSYL